MDHSPEFVALVDDAKPRVREIAVDDVASRMEAGAVLIDVREYSEWLEHASGAIHMGRGIIERDIVAAFPDKSHEIILYCGGGFRSALTADNLQKMGYKNVWSMAGGWRAWKEAEKPIEIEIPF